MSSSWQKSGSFNIANPFYVPGNDNSEELVAWLQVPNGTREEESQFVLDFVLAVETGLTFSGGPLALDGRHPDCSQPVPGTARDNEKAKVE